jgi:hypothetical protein
MIVPVQGGYGCLGKGDGREDEGVRERWGVEGGDIQSSKRCFDPNISTLL